MSEAVKSMSRKDILGWILTIGLPIVLLLVPTTEVYTKPVKLFLAITIFAILTFAFENLNRTVVCLAFPVLYIVLEIAPAGTVLSPWTQNVPWMVLGGLLLAEVLTYNGFLKRVAYKCIILTGGSFTGILVGLALAGVILNLMIPGKVAIPMAALALGLCNALNLGKSKESAAILLAAATGAVAPPMLFLYYPTFFMMVNAGKEVTGELQLGWADYFINNAPGIIFIVLVIAAARLLFKPDRPINGKAYFEAEYKELGDMSSSEKKSLAIVLLLFIALLTTNYHGVDAGWCFALIPLLCFLPVIDVAPTSILQKVDFTFIIFVASCMAIGSTAGSLGIGQIVANLALPVLQGKDASVVMIAIWLICFLLNFLLTPLAIMSAFSLPMASIAMELGINPLAVYFAMTNGLDQIILPYEYALYMVYFSFGLIRLKDWVKFFSVKSLIAFVYFVLILIPYWRFVGFM